MNVSNCSIACSSFYWVDQRTVFSDPKGFGLCDTSTSPRKPLFPFLHRESNSTSILCSGYKGIQFSDDLEANVCGDVDLGKHRISLFAPSSLRLHTRPTDYETHDDLYRNSRQPKVQMNIQIRNLVSIFKYSLNTGSK